MSFTEKIVVGKISVKVMHSGKVTCMAFTENSFKFMWGSENKKSYVLWLQRVNMYKNSTMHMTIINTLDGSQNPVP